MPTSGWVLPGPSAGVGGSTQDIYTPGMVYEADSVRRKLWRSKATRLLSDADVARLFGVTPGYIPKIRKKGWLPKRAKAEQGRAGGKGVPRYSFLDAVAAEVARNTSKEFGWPPRDLRRLVSIITAGDKNAVSASKIVAFRGDLPGTFDVVFYAPEKIEEGGKDTERLETARASGQIVEETSLLEVVEAVANSLYAKMKAVGIEFSSVGVGAKKRTRRAQ